MGFSIIYMEMCAAMAKKKLEDKEEQVSISVSRYKELKHKARSWDLLQNNVVISRRNYEGVFLRVQQEVSKYYHVELDAVKSRKRYRNYVMAKRAFMCVCLELGMGVSEIGKYLGYDHTTVIHHRETNKNLLDTDDEYATEMLQLIELVKHKLFNNNNNINEG